MQKKELIQELRELTPELQSEFQQSRYDNFSLNHSWLAELGMGPAP